MFKQLCVIFKLHNSSSVGFVADNYFLQAIRFYLEKNTGNTFFTPN